MAFFGVNFILQKFCPCKKMTNIRYVTGRLSPNKGEREDFLTRRPSFFCENGHNSGMKSRKIAPKEGNEQYLRGLQTGCWPKLGSYGKKRIFGPKTEIWGQKQHPLPNGHHVLAKTGKNCSKKKVPFSKINISVLTNFGCFFGIKRPKRPKTGVSPEK